MPRKSQRSESPESAFLFVNVDPTRQTRGGSGLEVDREKQSHVQRQTLARKRRTRGMRASSRGSRSDPGSSAEASTALTGQQFTDIPGTLEPDTSEQQNLDPNLFAIDTGSLSITPDESTSAILSQNFDFASTFPSSQIPTSSILPLNVLQDPIFLAPFRAEIPRLTLTGTSFDGISGVLEKWAPVLIQHYNLVILPEKFFADTTAVPLGQIRHADAIHADMRNVMSEPAHLYSFLASAAAQMYAREGRLLLPDLPEHDHHRIPLYFKTKAITAIRPKLARGSVDKATVNDVFRLMAVALYMDDYEAAESHLQALMSMVNNMGGLEAFDVYFVENNMLLDLSVSLKRLRNPRFPFVWDPNRNTSMIATNPDLLEVQEDYTGTSIEPVVRSGMFDTDLTDGFTDLVEVRRMHGWLRDQSEYVGEHYQWLCFRRMAIAYNLLSSQITFTAQEQAFRLAMLFHIALTRSPRPGRRNASRQAHTLRSALQSTRINDMWSPHADLLLWIVATGGMVALEVDERDWFVDITKKVAEELNVMDNDQLEEYLSGYLYDRASQHDVLVEFSSRVFTDVGEMQE